METTIPNKLILALQVHAGIVVLAWIIIAFAYLLFIGTTPEKDRKKNLRGSGFIIALFVVPVVIPYLGALWTMCNASAMDKLHYLKSDDRP